MFTMSHFGSRSCSMNSSGTSLADIKETHLDTYANKSSHLKAIGARPLIWKQIFVYTSFCTMKTIPKALENHRLRLLCDVGRLEKEQKELEEMQEQDRMTKMSSTCQDANPHFCLKGCICFPIDPPFFSLKDTYLLSYWPSFVSSVMYPFCRPWCDPTAPPPHTHRNLRSVRKMLMESWRGKTQSLIPNMVPKER
jgi:hypothetical protein